MKKNNVLYRNMGNYGNLGNFTHIHNMKIQANDIDNIEIGIYETTWNTQRKSVATIIQWLTEIQPSNRERVLAMRNEPNETKQNQMKGDLCGATFSALFKPDRRKGDNVEHLNSVMVIDIDHHDNEGLELIDLRETIFYLPYVYAVSASCRGKGLYAIIPINKPEYQAEYYKAVSYILENDFGIVCDKQCKDITRLRLVSYDPDTLIKKGEVEVFDKVLKTSLPKVEAPRKRPKYVSNESDNDLDRKFAQLVNELIHNHFDTGGHWGAWACLGHCFVPFANGKELFRTLSLNMSGYDEEFDYHWQRIERDRTSQYVKQSKEESIAYITAILNTNYPDWRRHLV